jgi:hypothetical protein
MYLHRDVKDKNKFKFSFNEVTYVVYKSWRRYKYYINNELVFEVTKLYGINKRKWKIIDHLFEKTNYVVRTKKKKREKRTKKNARKYRKVNEIELYEVFDENKNLIGYRKLTNMKDYEEYNAFNYNVVELTIIAQATILIDLER